MPELKLPHDLRGYRLEPRRGSLLRKLIFLIIIVLAVLWLVDKQIVLDIFERLKEFLRQ